jgi:hypothetical protein
MDLESYCGCVGAELTGWKAKLGRVVDELDHIATGDKTKVAPQVNELHMIMEEFDDRINRLRTHCSTQFAPEKIEVEGKFSGTSPDTKGVRDNVSPADFGG